MKPLIGITTGEIINKTESWSGTVYGQNHQYSDAILSAGGVPVLIPFMPEAELKEVYSHLDGVLFAGGNDINPSLYHELKKPRTKHISEERDEIERLLFQWTLNDNKPLLAICRGFQMLNVVNGGTLYQDLPSEFPNSSDHELSSLEEDVSHIAHRLRLLPESRLAHITQTTMLDSNTHHHQGIKDLAENLTAVGWSEDGLVEAIEDTSKAFVMGVQGHPESLYSHEHAWAKFFHSFIDASSKK